MMDNLRWKNQCLNICHECIEDCEFNKDEQFVDTELGGTWIKIGNEYGLYVNGVCIGIVKVDSFRIQQLKLRIALNDCKEAIKKAFWNDLRKIKEFFRRW